jgi:LAS superfamily LD-carboxypeptidase LdcB
VNPEFRFHLENAMRAARAAGFNIEVSEAYRSPERSQVLYEDSVRTYEQRRANLMAQIQATDDPAERQRLNTQLQNLTRPPAAPAWSSAHNYGIAVDIRLRDNQNNILTVRF